MPIHIHELTDGNIRSFHRRFESPNGAELHHGPPHRMVPAAVGS
jgi:hypothetical protein